MRMYDIIGVAYDVHKILHRGLEEAIYQEAMEIECERRDMNVEPQKLINCYYDGIKMKKYYLADLYYEGVVVELKSVEHIGPEHRAQLFNYLRLTHSKCGVLINFGESNLHSERYIYNEIEDNFILLTKENFQNYIKE